MKKSTAHLYCVTISFQSERGYRRNTIENVVATSVIDAAETVSEEYKDHEDLHVWNVVHLGKVSLTSECALDELLGQDMSENPELEEENAE